MPATCGAIIRLLKQVRRTLGSSTQLPALGAGQVWRRGSESGAEPDWGRGSEGTEQGRGGVRPRGCGLRRDCVGGESRAGGSSGAVPAGRAGPDRRSVWPWA